MEILNGTRDLNVILPKVFLFVTGILTEFLRIIFIKISLLKTYIATHKVDIICLSETYLDSSISNDDENLKILGYDLFRADHLCNTKWSRLCIYWMNASILTWMHQFWGKNRRVNYVFFCLYIVRQANRKMILNLLRTILN